GLFRVGAGTDSVQRLQRLLPRLIGLPAGLVVALGFSGPVQPADKDVHRPVTVVRVEAERAFIDDHQRPPRSLIPPANGCRSAAQARLRSNASQIAAIAASMSADVGTFSTPLPSR